MVSDNADLFVGHLISELKKFNWSLVESKPDEVVYEKDGRFFQIGFPGGRLQHVFIGNDNTMVDLVNDTYDRALEFIRSEKWSVDI